MHKIFFKTNAIKIKQNSSCKYFTKKINFHTNILFIYQLFPIFHEFHMFIIHFISIFHNFYYVHNFSQNISHFSEMFCEILPTDFTEMAALQKFWFAASYAR